MLVLEIGVLKRKENLENSKLLNLRRCNSPLSYSLALPMITRLGMARLG
jgi:hypothetical protein